MWTSHLLLSDSSAPEKCITVEDNEDGKYLLKCSRLDSFPLELVMHFCVRICVCRSWDFVRKGEVGRGKTGEGELVRKRKER
jgi:hypothetical protein